HASPALRSLHSFPTRRSSDLFMGARLYLPWHDPRALVPDTKGRQICPSWTTRWRSSPDQRAASDAPPPSSSPSTAPRSWSTTSRSEEHTSELQSLAYLVCRLL